ncbi:type II toxin-antitoxin system HicB family antitoxin [Cyanobacteria bacterium FACHB-63]|nr:type II toxin-antitoxin system HicB family antitoxin [Cyanobacteria bacterium FACHB-63]
MRYVIVIEKGKTSYGAYVPDLPSCVAVGGTIEEARELIQEEAVVHLEEIGEVEELREDGLTVPESCDLKVC